MPAFSKKHYATVVRVLARLEEDTPYACRGVDYFAQEFAADNPNFSTDRFYAAYEEQIAERKARANT